MSTVTPNLGLVKPTTLEQYALSVLNNNMDKIDLASAFYTTATSTLDTAACNCTGSIFTRIRIGATQGIVVALIDCNFDTAVTLAANTAGGTVIGNVCPSGYMPATTLNMMAGVIAGNGRGDNIQWALTGGVGQLQIRSNGASFNTVVNSSMTGMCVYRWDGNL